MMRRNSITLTNQLIGLIVIRESSGKSSLSAFAGLVGALCWLTTICCFGTAFIAIANGDEDIDRLGFFFRLGLQSFLFGLIILLLRAILEAVRSR